MKQRENTNVSCFRKECRHFVIDSGLAKNEMQKVKQYYLFITRICNISFIDDIF